MTDTDDTGDKPTPLQQILLDQLRSLISERTVELSLWQAMIERTGIEEFALITGQSLKTITQADRYELLPDDKNEIKINDCYEAARFFSELDLDSPYYMSFTNGDVRRFYLHERGAPTNPFT